MNLNDYNIYTNYARQCLHNNNEAAFVAYRIALHLAPPTAKADIQKQYDQFIKESAVSENALGSTCTDLMLERLNNHEYKETFAILTELLFDDSKYLRHIFCVKYNLLIYILNEASLCELNRGIPEQDISLNHYESLDDFYESYKNLKFILRRIWFHIDYQDSLLELSTLLTSREISIDLLAVMIKYAIARPCYKIVFNDIYSYLNEHSITDASLFHQYADWVCKIIPQSNDLVFEPHAIQSPELIPTYINAKNSESHNILSDHDPATDRIAIILCANQRIYTEELMRYIRRLIIPDEFSLEVLVVTNATSMAQGYNAGMHATSAKYKLYIHQDTFLLDVNILVKTINFFHKDPSIGVLGIAGSTKLPDDGVWWNADSVCHRTCIIQDDFLDIISVEQNNSSLLNQVENVEALDGIFLATTTDINWRDDLFDSWHFYDISQCQEFIKAGYRVVYYNSPDPVAIHELSMNQFSDPAYEKYRKIYCHTYLTSK